MNAIMVHKYQIGRARTEKGEWVTGWITPSADSDPGLHCDDQCFKEYEVLTASMLSYAPPPPHTHPTPKDLIKRTIAICDT